MSLASISVDLDGFAGMYRTRRWDPPRGVRDLNAVHSDALPRFLDLFEEVGIRATFFVVGEDARSESNRDRLAAAARAGHEIGNHSQHHLHLPELAQDEARREVLDAHEALRSIPNVTLAGFRSPAWMPTEALLDLLVETGYLYDASVFPTPWMSVWRDRHSLLRGRLPNGPDRPWIFAPRAPYRIRPRLWEVPTATDPFFRLPVWGTLLHWLGPEAYRALVRMSGIGAPVSLVLHGWELVDFALIGDPRFLSKPGIDRPVGSRLSRLRDSLLWMKERWELVTLETLVRRMETASPLPSAVKRAETRSVAKASK